MIECEVPGIAYAYLVGSRDWKKTVAEWSESELAAALLKLRGRVGFGIAVHILCVEPCQREVGAIHKLESRESTSEWKDRCC